eukprot:CAMPEP_0204868728 /NCGR_PEP_ID=MMETSP1348-20121228/27682_1 /ASSEMBLY_ACC=CAM_ASM_000700 /TAXON_ID=215587 /ORGANISM="Aplanochytrium stocchinoi, Strain GSBS06" /LENGTH=433 /DNA_ID=CAMNT_0052021793 /DNA_START=61 /DNA_END=1362 /DNA_ORIENTATION=+
MTHARILTNLNEFKNVLMLAGGDAKIHFYHQHFFAPVTKHLRTTQQHKQGQVRRVQHGHGRGKSDTANMSQYSEEASIGTESSAEGYEYYDDHLQSREIRKVANEGSDYNVTLENHNDEDDENDDVAFIEDVEDYFLYGETGKVKMNPDNRNQHNFIEPESSDAQSNGMHFIFNPIQGYTLSIPGLDSLPSPALSLKTLEIESPSTSATSAKRQVIAVGCRDGTVRCICKDVESTVLSSMPKVCEVKLQGPIPSLELLQGSDCNEDEKVDLIVGGSLGYAAVYSDILDSTNPSLSELNIQTPEMLPHSNMHDSVLCIHAADLDLDGCKEVAIGTYGQELLVYKRMRRVDSLRTRSESITNNNMNRYRLLWRRSFAHPLYSINTGDFNQDGANELIVNSLHGIHILQPDMEKAANKILLSVEKLHHLKQLEENL